MCVLVADVFVQSFSDDVHIRSRHQFRSVDPGEKDLSDLLSALLLKFNGCDVIKVKVGIGLLEKKKPCHFSFLLSAPQTVKRSRGVAFAFGGVAAVSDYWSKATRRTRCSAFAFLPLPGTQIIFPAQTLSLGAESSGSAEGRLSLRRVIKKISDSLGCRDNHSPHSRDDRADGYSGMRAT